jgi:hypothetical protein
MPPQSTRRVVDRGICGEAVGVVDLSEFLRENFEYYQHARHWYSKAIDLRKSSEVLAAEILPQVDAYEAAVLCAEEQLDKTSSSSAEIKCDEPNVLPIYLLYGYALENAFKAVIISKDPSLIRAEKIAPEVNGHDLTVLASLASIALSDIEKQIMRWLSEVVVWKGRYNAPTKSHALGRFWALDHSHNYSFRPNLKCIDDVFGRITSALPPEVIQQLGGYGAVVRIDRDP